MGEHNTIVVVDNSSSTRRAAVNTIRTQINNVTVTEFSNSQQALAALQGSEKVNCIISDLELGNGRGVEFIEKAKLIPSCKHASYMVMSSRRDRGALLEAAAVGVSDYILKPFNGNTLSLKVRKLVNIQQRSSERVTLFETFSARINFGNTNYKACIIDLSLGGCLMRAEIFKQGGCIYDQADINIEHEDNEDISVKAILVRAERDQESPDNTTMLVAFQFVTTNQNDIDRLSQLIASSKNLTLK
jgi:CheY-like chemotaxis protein